jgi:hypothetical protein
MTDEEFEEFAAVAASYGTLISEDTIPEQEPVCPDCTAKVLYECVFCSSNNYPPKEQPEQWVGLTDEDRAELDEKYYWYDVPHDVMYDVEAKLKEKNYD